MDKLGRKTILAAAVAAILAAPLVAQAARVEFSAGSTHYGTHDGIWYNSFYPCHNATDAASQILSIKTPGWRFSLVHLGTARSGADWGTHERTDEIAHPEYRRVAVYHGIGQGDALGVSVGKTYGKDFGNLHVGVEGGLFLYRGRWTERIYPMHSRRLLLTDDKANVNLTTYAGIAVRYRELFVEARDYYNVQNGFPNHSAKQITAGISVEY